MPAEVDSLFYTGEAPWHRIGTKLDGPATAEEAISAAGLGWRVIQEPVYTRKGFTYTQVPDKLAVMRADTRTVFNVMSDQFSPLQNSSAFTFFDDVVGAGEAVYHVAGSLRSGRRVFILAKLPDTIDLGGDRIDQYILLANSHDGSTAVVMKPTPVRVVCMNTLQVALADNTGRAVRLRHVGNIAWKVNEAREALGLTQAYYQLFTEHVARLASTRILEGAAEDFYAKLVDYKPGDSDQPKSRKEAFDMLVSCYNNAPGQHLDTAEGTVWGLVNGVTAYVDYATPVRGAKSNATDVDARRVERSWFGQGQDLRQRAWDSAMELVPVTVAMGGRLPQDRRAMAMELPRG